MRVIYAENVVARTKNVPLKTTLRKPTPIFKQNVAIDLAGKCQAIFTSLKWTLKTFWATQAPDNTFSNQQDQIQLGQ